MTRAFDPDRYAPTSVAVLLQLPPSNARSFAVASAIGRILDLEGTTERIRSGKAAAGTRIDSQRLPIVLEALDLKERRWRQVVADWEHRYIAHRCGGGKVFLFARALPEACAGCGTKIEYTHVPDAPRARRGEGFAGSGTAAPPAVVLPQNGTGTAAAAAQVLPPSRTDAPHRETGIYGMGLGVPRTKDREASERVHGLLEAVDLQAATAAARLDPTVTTLTDLVVSSWIRSLIEEADHAA